MIRYFDNKYHFAELFDENTGTYIRTGILDDKMNDTGVDPFMRSFPSLIDIGIMGRCVCASKCHVDCYQNAAARNCLKDAKNMSIDDYKLIMSQCKGKVFQVALGGAGDPDTHEDFEEILRVTRDNNIVPNFTTSGITMNREKALMCKKYCGAVAVSEHNAIYTHQAFSMLKNAGVKTNVHYVLSNQTIDAAIDRLKRDYYSMANAVVFLLYKPVGLGKVEKVLRVDDPRLKEFFKVIEDHPFTHKVGFDSCTAPAIVNLTSQINMDSIDYCEGGRHSMYIDHEMNAMPCSFGNQDSKWFVSLRNHTIEEAWNSNVFETFRKSLQNSCTKCTQRSLCAGGCPIVRDIVLCEKSEKELV